MRRWIVAVLLLLGVRETAEGRSLTFNGSTDYVRGTPLPGTPMANPSSFFCWGRATTLGVDANMIGTFASTSTRRRTLGVGAGNFVTATASGVATGTAASSSMISVNTWFSGAAILATTVARSVYRDGANPGTDVVEVLSVTAPDRISLGRTDASTPARYFTGQIAGCAAWNAILTAKEVASLNKGVSPRLIQPHLLFFYTPYLGVGTTVQDWFGAAIAMTGTATSTESPPRFSHP